MADDITQQEKELLKTQSKEWRDSDNTLRRGISRLTFAIGGIDPKLDTLLSELRNAIRENQPTAILVELINAIADLVKGMDDHHSGDSSDDVSGDELALKILHGLAFPDAQRKRAKKLAQRFTSKHDTMEVLHDELKQLLQLCFTSTQVHHANTAEPGGWLDRLAATFIHHPQSHSGTSAVPATTSLSIAKYLLIELMRRIQAREEDADTVKSLIYRLESSGDEAALETIVAEFSEVVNVAYVVRHPRVPIDNKSENVDIPCLQDVFIQFIDELAK